MYIKIQPQEYGFVRDYIAEISGNLLADGKEYLIENRLGGLVAELGCRTFAELCKKARGIAGKELRNKIVDGITINETHWFRDQHPFKIILERLLPEFEHKVFTRQRSSFRIWSAASSTGQEAYSTAMMVHEFCRRSVYLEPEMFEIVGTDICNTALSVAKSGCYDRLTMSRGLSSELRDRYFTESDRQWQIDDAMRKMVKFQYFNLMDSYSMLGKFDIVFCRNVAIYFSRERKIQLYKKIASIMNPQGILFLGSSESLSAYNSDFLQLKHQRGLCYRLDSE